MRAKRNHISAPVVVMKDRAVIRSSFRHSMGPPLAHADTVAIALTPDEQLVAHAEWLTALRR